MTSRKHQLHLRFGGPHLIDLFEHMEMSGGWERCLVPASLQSIFFPSSRDLWIWRDRPEIPGKDVGIQYGGQFSEERKKTEPPSPFKVKI